MESGRSLTTKAYWERYYKYSTVEKERIVRICGAYDDIWAKMIKACSHPPRSIMEIGAYPGRYIAYLAAKYNLQATALDFNSDYGRIEEAFMAMGVSQYRVIQTDFLGYRPMEKHDIVYSLGFVEHFENFDEVLDRHLDHVIPGGVFVVMVPNLRFVRKYYAILCDRANLKVHNLECMNRNVFIDFAARNKLEIRYLKYWGGFSYRVHQKLNWWQLQVYRVARLIFKNLNPLIEKFPSKYLSSTIVGIFVVPEQ